MDQFEAAVVGNLQWFKDAKDLGTLPNLNSSDFELSYVHEIAAVHGHLEILIWCAQESGQAVDLATSNNYAVRRSAASGNLEILKWLLEESSQELDATAFHNNAIQLAAENGHLDVVQYLLETSTQMIDPTERNNYALHWSFENEHYDVHSYLTVSLALIAEIGLDDFRMQRKCLNVEVPCRQLA